jgi:Protein of unknown function (DUF2911)
MKKTFFIFLFLMAFYTIKAQDHKHEHTANTVVDTIKGSIAQETHAMVGENHYTIKYYSPAVRGRVIWGGLVAYGQVWVTGAHSATSIEFTKDVKINNTVVKAGKYAFFTIPNKKKWTMIINKNFDQHLADEYDAKDDVVRLEVKPKKQKQLTERLKYEIEAKNAKTAELSVSWEKLKISLPLETVK